MEEKVNMRNSRRRNQGFTLLEMLAVVVLLGIVATIVVRQVGGNVDKGKYGAGKAQLASLSMKIENYAMDVGAAPARLEDLVAQPAGAPPPPMMLPGKSSMPVSRQLMPRMWPSPSPRTLLERPCRVSRRSRYGA